MLWQSLVDDGVLRRHQQLVEIRGYVCTAQPQNLAHGGHTLRLLPCCHLSDSFLLAVLRCRRRWAAKWNLVVAVLSHLLPVADCDQWPITSLCLGKPTSLLWHLVTALKQKHYFSEDPGVEHQLPTAPQNTIGRRQRSKCNTNQVANHGIPGNIYL